MSDNPWKLPFEPGTLWQKVLHATQRGRASGSLLPIPTNFVEIDDVGVRFVVRVVDNLRRKQQARVAQLESAERGAPANPFLPYDELLYVADVSDTHVAVLNKFNVIDHHLLIVTRAFEHQEMLLNTADFYAVWRCLREVDGLVFYNGGVVAGASQIHKHLQLGPYPITKGRDRVPVDGVVRAALKSGIGRVDTLPFQHSVAPCEPEWCDDAHEAACACHTRYLALLAATGIEATPGVKEQPAPYNLLLTRDWLMLVPRVEEFFEGMSINAIGYAGGLLVRNDDELARVRDAGPMRVIAAGAISRQD